jgi:uncharacterized protein (TIGR03083 family)
MAFPELEVFAAEARGVEATLRGVAPDAWARRALGVWTLAELTAHLVRGARLTADYLDEPVGGDTAVCDRVSYFRFDHDGAAASVADRARLEASKYEAHTLPDVFAAAWRRTLDRAGAEDPARLLHTFRGPMRIDEYVPTRILELVVHHHDVRRALELPPAPDPAAERLTAGILEGLLGGPRPRNLGRTRFVLAATGRIPSDDDRFPVLH